MLFEFRKFKPQFYHKVCSIETKQSVMMLFGPITVPLFPLEALLELLGFSVMEAENHALSKGIYLAFSRYRQILYYFKLI